MNENENFDRENLLDSTESEQQSSEAKPSPLLVALDWIQMIAVYFSVAILILTVFFTHSPVVGSSMNPTLNNGDMLIISRFAYTPKNGDIIVCQSERYGLETPLVKRIIATEGQTVTIDSENRTITVDGVVLSEDYIHDSSTPFQPSDYLPETFTVEEGKVFVMGDNRFPGGSIDSRFQQVGMIDERYIIGRVLIRIFPLSEIEIF